MYASSSYPSDTLAIVPREEVHLHKLSVEIFVQTFRDKYFLLQVENLIIRTIPPLCVSDKRTGEFGNFMNYTHPSKLL